jgi:PAS domain S-box-containing protein
MSFVPLSPLLTALPGLFTSPLPAVALGADGTPSLLDGHTTAIFVAVGVALVESIILVALALNIVMRRRAERALLAAGEELERKVEQRTAELADANTALVTEIRERHAAMESLRQSEERYRQIFYNNDAVKLLIDAATGDIVEANDAAAEYYGYRRDILTAMTIDQINMLAPAEVKAERERARAEKRKHFFFRHRKASGEIRDVEVFSGPVVAPGQTLLFSIVLDVGDRTAAVDALKASEARYRSIFTMAPLGLIHADGDGRFAKINPAAVAMLGYAEEELIGKSWRELTHPEDADASDAYFREALEGKRDGFRLEKRLRSKGGGDIWANLTVAVERNPAGGVAGFVGIVEDIGPRKKAERAALNARNRAEEATRMKDTFVSLVAHDLKSPLAAAAGLIRTVEAGATDGDDDRREPLRRVAATLDRTLIIIEKLLDINRLQSGRTPVLPRFVDPEKVVAMALAQTALQAEAKEVRIENRVAAGGRVFVDPHLMAEVVANLLSNAVKFCRRGTGRVVVEAAYDPSPALTVTDNGVGMSEELAASLFRQDARSARPGSEGEQGVGLGLLYCHDVVTAQHGALTVVSAEGKGTTFTVTLPARRPRILVDVDDPAPLVADLAALGLDGVIVDRASPPNPDRRMADYERDGRIDAVVVDDDDAPLAATARRRTIPSVAVAREGKATAQRVSDLLL